MTDNKPVESESVVKPEPVKETDDTETKASDPIDRLIAENESPLIVDVNPSEDVLSSVPNDGLSDEEDEGELDESEGHYESHEFEPFYVHRPTCCNLCKSLILIVGNSYICTKCSAICHEGCRDKLIKTMKCKLSAGLAAPADSAPYMHHQWIDHNVHVIPDNWPALTEAERNVMIKEGRGNLDAATSCCVCGHDAGSVFNAQSNRMRCMWCWRVSHNQGSVSRPKCAAIAATQPCYGPSLYVHCSS